MLNDKILNNYFLNSGGCIVFNGGELMVIMKEFYCLVDGLEDWLKVFFLMYYQGFKYEEIVQEFDIFLGMVKSWIFFVCKKLQEGLKGMYQF